MKKVVIVPVHLVCANNWLQDKDKRHGRAAQGVRERKIQRSTDRSSDPHDGQHWQRNSLFFAHLMAVTAQKYESVDGLGTEVRRIHQQDSLPFEA